MSGYIARVGKHNIAFGLMWTLLPGVDRMGKEIKKLALDHDATSYVSLPVNGKQPLLGLLPASAYLEKGASSASASSAAAMLSFAFRGTLENAVFGIALPKGKVAFLGFRDGYPLIGFDRVIPVDSLDELTADFLREFGSQASTVQFTGTEGLFEGRDAAPFDSAWFAKATKKALAAARVRRAKSRGFLWLLLFLLGAGLFGALEAYDSHQKANLAKMTQKVQDPNDLYAKSIGAYLDTAGVHGAIVAGPMIDAVNRLPLFHEGWRIEKAACTPGSCVITWSNGDGGTYQSFAASPLPGIVAFKTAYKEGMTTLETTFDYAVTSAQGFKSELLPTQEKFILNFGSNAQQMKAAGLAINVDKAVLVGLPPTPAGMQAITESVLKAPVREGTWKMTGDWLFYDVLTTLPANMTVEAIELGVSGESMSMNVSGKYYVKN